MNKFVKQVGLLVLFVSFVIVVGVGMGIGGYLYGKNKGEDNMRSDLEEKFQKDIDTTKSDCKTEKDDIKKLYQERIDELKSDLSSCSTNNNDSTPAPTDTKTNSTKE